MFLLSEGSEDTIPHILDLHSTLPTQVAFESKKEVVYYPKNSIEKDGPIIFKFVVPEDEMIDAFDMLLTLAVQILDQKSLIIERRRDGGTVSGAAPADNPKRFVLPVNGMNSSMFKSIEFKINGERVSASHSLYAHQANIEMRLSLPKSVKESSLCLAGFYEERIAFDVLDAEQIKTLEGNSPIDKNLKRRLERAYEGRHIVTKGRLHTEMCDQTKLLPPNCHIDIKLTPQDSKFYLLSKVENEEYRARILSSSLKVNHYKINPSINREIHDVTQTMVTRYPVRRVTMNYYTRTAGLTDLSDTLVITGVKPRRIVLALVNLQALHGDLTRDPYNYQHYNLREAAVICDGTSYPTNPMTMNYGRQQYETPYYYLLKGTDSYLTDKDLGITLDNFAKRNCLYVFDLTSTGEPAADAFELTRNVNIDIHLLTDTPTTENVAVLLYCEYDAEITIDSKLNVEYRK